MLLFADQIPLQAGRVEDRALTVAVEVRVIAAFAPLKGKTECIVIRVLPHIRLTAQEDRHIDH